MKLLNWITLKRKAEIFSSLPIALNVALIFLGIFILITMSVVMFIFEEFTAFTDYTQDWIEFNFFISYWDKLTISRVYLWFIFIYGGVILTISSMQIHAYRKKNINLQHFTPYLLIIVAVITLLGSICWLIVTAVNFNEGFLATGGFIFERMRFKGNVWKDLRYREQAWKLVAAKQVPVKSPFLYTWVHQRSRDFECCGWNSYEDYIQGGWAELPESCCKRKYRSFRCGANYLNNTGILNTRGCGQVMHNWYRSGFNVNIVIATLGILVASYEIFLYAFNRKQYNKFLNDLDEYRRPMIIQKKPISLKKTPTGIYSEVKTLSPTSKTRPQIALKNFDKLNQFDNDDDTAVEFNCVNDGNVNYTNSLTRPFVSQAKIYRPLNGSSVQEREKLNSSFH